MKPSYLTVTDLDRRAKLQALIDRKDAERGRPLTDAEKMANMERAMTHCWTCDGYVGWSAEKCEHCGRALV
jgi:hypothetical protein